MLLEDHTFDYCFRAAQKKNTAEVGRDAESCTRVTNQSSSDGKQPGFEAG